MTRVLVAGVAAALLMATALSPAVANGHGGGGGIHGGGTGAFHGGGFHGGERFHEAFRGGEFHGGERFHDHDRFRGPVIVGGLALGLGAVGGAVIPPSVSYGRPKVGESVLIGFAALLPAEAWAPADTVC